MTFKVPSNPKHSGFYDPSSGVVNITVSWCCSMIRLHASKLFMEEIGSNFPCFAEEEIGAEACVWGCDSRSELRLVQSLLCSQPRLSL